MSDEGTYRVRFTQEYEVNGIEKARGLASDLLKRADPGVSKASAEIHYQDEDERCPRR